jgi:hypothetical protein
MKLTIALPLALALTACGGGSSISPNALNATTSGSNVYAVGYSEAPSTGTRIAMYWHAGTSIALTDGTSNSEANAVVVDSAENVYVAGFTKVSGVQVAALWKNGSLTTLSSGTTATGLFLDSSGNVYVSGATSSQAVYWKNGALTTLSGGTFATSISVDSSGNVYVVGQTSSGMATWRNGALSTVSGAAAHDSLANLAIDSSGNVFMSGVSSTNSAVYWKNGVSTALTSGSGLISQGIWVDSSNNLYVVGTTGSSPWAVGYWMNGTFSSLLGAGQYPMADGDAITTDSSGNVYVGGMYTTNPNTYPQIAAYWVNGVKVDLWQSGLEDAEVYSIFVK